MLCFMLQTKSIAEEALQHVLALCHISSPAEVDGVLTSIFERAKVNKLLWAVWTFYSVMLIITIVIYDEYHPQRWHVNQIRGLAK